MGGEEERFFMNKDVAIIGGSAAGFFTASLLAQQGLRVRVFEAEDHIRSFSRTLIVTNQVRHLLAPLSKGAVVNEIHRFELLSGNRTVTVLLQQPDLVIERSMLIKELKAQAKAKGANVLTGHRFLSLKPKGKGLAFTVSRNDDGEQIEELAEILVGADGASSKVAKSAGLPKQPTVPLFQAIVELPKDMPSDVTRVWFIPEETPFFYWLIPYSPTQGVLGLIGEENHEIRGSLERFLEKRGLEPIEFQNAQVPHYTRWIPNHRKLGESHVYLVGDAAAHVKVSTMGGIVTGFRGALGVAEAILNGGSSREFRYLRRELDLHMLIRRALNRFTQEDYASLLNLLTPSVKRSLSRFNRDDSGKLLFNSLLKQPRLLLLGLRYLLYGK